MVTRIGRMTLVTLGLLAATAVEARAQSLGTYRFQLQPYCNVVVVNITQNGSVYTLDGYDDLCGATQRASVVGMALLNPDGTVGFGMTIVAAPGGTPTQVYATASPVTGNGSWRDGAGASGSFILTPGASTGGSLRPIPPSGLPDGSVTSAKILDGAVGSSDINAAQVQQRVAGACASGQLMTGVNQDGTVVCQAVTSGSGGDITGVAAGTGLTGGGTTGDVTLTIAYAGPGSSTFAARADHTHDAGGTANTRVGDGALPSVGGVGTNTALGASALAANTSGSANTAAGANVLLQNIAGRENTGAGYNALRNVTASGNTGVGWTAGQLTSSGANNTFVGRRAGFVNTTGTGNTVLGGDGDLGSNNLTNATAIGYRARVDASNAMVLGSIDGVNGAGSNTYVGIGTTTPNAPLDIDFEATPTDGDAMRVASSSGVNLSLLAYRGLRSAPTAVQSGDFLSTIRTDGYTGSGFTNNGRAAITAEATENWTASANGTRLAFHTTADGTAGMLERMRITNGGQVAIGRNLAAQLLDVNGNVRVGTGTTGCVEDRDGTLIAGTCSSDARLKRDIASFPSMLDKVSRLRPVTYFWRSEELPDRHFGASQSFGLIAQEVEALLPDMVTTDAQGYKAVNYSKLPLLTLQAVKELVAENDTLKTQVRDQQGDVAALRAELASMRTLVEQLVAAQR